MAAIPLADVQVGHSQLCRFGDTCPDISKKQQKSVFDPTPLRRAVRNVEQGIRLGLAQRYDGLLGRPFHRNAPDSTGPSEMGRITAADEAGEDTDGRQALIASLDGTAPVILKMTEELQNQFRRNVVNREPIIRFPELGADERHEQLERIQVALLRI